MIDKTTHFGYEDVPSSQKSQRVGRVFTSVAERYDLMNDLMSLGMHRLWKHQAVSHMHLRPHFHVLDVAAGSGDMSRLIAKSLGPKGRLTLTDINSAMLSKGRDRLIDAGVVNQVDYVLADAEKLPWPAETFDAIMIAFGLRNVTDQIAALNSFYRVLKIGGKLSILEFSHPVISCLKPLYDRYSFAVLPRLGRWIAHDEASYRYLAESIRRHPDQETLISMMQAVGFDQCHYQNWSGGIVALHTGFKV